MLESFEIVDGGTQGKTGILRVWGRLDARSAPQLLRAGTEARKKGLHLVLDLSGVTFMASSGLGSLLSLAEEYRTGVYRLRLAAPSAAVTSVIRLLNLDQFLAVAASETEALHELEA